MNVHVALRSIIVVLVGFVGALPLSTMAQQCGPSIPNCLTFTTTVSQSQWNAYGKYMAATTYVGPETIMVDDLGSCTLTLPYNCNPSSGTGTQSDPYSCTTPPVLTKCSGGSPRVIAFGFINYDARTDYFVPAIAPIAEAAPVPLSPWVPAGSAFGAMLLVLMRRRANAG